MTEIDVLFDRMSSAYDSDFTNTGLGHYYRMRVQRHIQSYWKGGKNILEINAGTGEDAIFLARLGNHVLATDRSLKMLDVAKDKVEQYRFSDRVRTKNLAIEELIQLSDQQFDGLLSNFGGLNCVEDLKGFTQALAPLIKPQGIVIVCIMGPYVPWEWLWYSLRGQFRKAFRRLSGQAHWQGCTIYYPTARKMKRLMEEASFQCISQEAIGVLMPPTYARATVEKWPKLFRFLARMEEKIANFTLATSLADHYVLIFQKNGMEADHA